MSATALISAGDVEKFGYCPLSWWLSRGLAPEEGDPIVEGETKHEVASTELKGVESQERSAREAEVAVMYFAIAATIIAIVGVAFVPGYSISVVQLLALVSLIWLLAAVFFLYRAETLSTRDERFLSERILLVCAMGAAVLAASSVFLPLFPSPTLAEAFLAIALGWLVGASEFLYRSMRLAGSAIQTRRRYHVAGDLVYIDSQAEKPKLFLSKRYNLSGRPDAVVLDGEAHIPVEIKTGRTPRGPLFSHILQVTAYCLLLEEEYGRAPPYGIIRYEDAAHEIEYNEDQKKLLITKLAEMRACLARGEAHRNHTRPGKCIHCSRRSVCPERLA